MAQKIDDGEKSETMAKLQGIYTPENPATQHSRIFC